jgi:hypothetical protein
VEGESGKEMNRIHIYKTGLERGTCREFFVSESGEIEVCESKRDFPSQGVSNCVSKIRVIACRQQVMESYLYR